MPLSGTRIVDLTQLLPGPYCTSMLADMGATVIKVEPVGGDFARNIPPLFRGKNIAFETLNRNKRGIAIDIGKEKGKEVLMQLVKWADILVEGFRPQVMKKLGLDYEVLSKVKKRLIYCAITGYGQESRYSERAGHDVNYLALSGFLSLNCNAKGEPLLLGVQIADVVAGSLMAAIGILAALHFRDRTGKGQFVDISMTDGAMSLMPLQMSRALACGIEPKPTEDMLNGGLACYNIYGTLDGRFMSLGAFEPKFWQTFCHAVGREDLISEHLSCGARGQKVKEDIAAIFKKRTQAEWIRFFEEHDCCCEPVLSLLEALCHSLARSRNMRIAADPKKGIVLDQIGFPIKFSATPSVLRRGAPNLGEHNLEVMRELGYSEEDINRLTHERVLG